jgi:hypothetical protein
MSIEIKKNKELKLDIYVMVLQMRNPCERAGWRSFRGKGPDCTEGQGSRMIAETNA